MSLGNLLMGLFIFVTVLTIALVNKHPVERKYIETDMGLFSYHNGYCVFGALTNNQYVNIMSVDGKPIACSGYIKLTDAEADKYRAGE